MAADGDARKCAFSVRIDAALEDHAFHAASFRFRFVDGTKKQTPPVGAAGWTPHPETPGSWRFEVAITDVLVTETLAGAIDDDPIVAFVLSDVSAGATHLQAPAPAAAAAGSAKTSARPTTAVVASPQDAASPRGSKSTTSGRGRLIADVFELDTSAFFSADCLHVEQTWSAHKLSETEKLDDGDTVFASRSKRRDPLEENGRSLFALASGIRSVTVRIGIDQPLLSPALRHKLNPLVLTVRTARRLPGVSSSMSRPHDALASRCRPVYALWRFFPDRRLYALPQRPRLVITSGRAHGESVHWQHTTTVLSGRCDAAELYDALQTASLAVELHDRDAVRVADASLEKLHAKWESLHATGVDPTLPATSSTQGTPGSLVTVNGSRNVTPRGSPKPLDAFSVDEVMKHDWHALLGCASESFAFGVALFRLDELLLTTNALSSIETSAKPFKTLELTADVVASKRRATPIGAAALAERETSGATVDMIADTPLDKRTREPGAYLASGTTLRLDVSLQHALLPPPCPSLSSSSSPPLFSRLVLLFPYHDTATLSQLMRVLETVNRSALSDGISLRSYQLTPQETRDCERGELDVLTGWMVIDDDVRVVALEGHADGGMRHVHHALPRTIPASESFRMYANAHERFPQRLYTAFGVDLKRIKLRSALPTLLQMPDIYMRTKVAEPCYAALTKLMELRRVERLREAKVLDLFPTAAMLLELESKYGESISLEDIYGTKKTTGNRVASAGDTSTETPEGDRHDEGKQAEATARHATPTRLKAPTDATNPQFEASRRSRQSHDYVAERKKLHDDQQRAYREKKQEQDDALRNDPRASAPVYLYSGQKLRSQDTLQEDLRRRLASDHRSTFTYGPDFQSLALSLVNPDELRQAEERESRKKWTTQRGFVYPAPRPTIEYYQHADAPSKARCEDLREPFVDNANHPKPVSRDNNRGADSRPQLSTLPSKDLVFGGLQSDGSSDPHFFRSVHLCGGQARREMDEALEREHAEWERKLVIDRKQLKFLAHGNTCSQPSGPQLSQLDKLQDVLRGPVLSKPLRIVRNATLPSGKRVPLQAPPASITSLQTYAGPVAATFASTLRQPTDTSVAFLATDVATGKPQDFHFPSVSNVLTPSVKLHTSTYHVICPVQPQDKRGFLWGNTTTTVTTTLK